jgi:hypothetical protein
MEQSLMAILDSVYATRPLFSRSTIRTIIDRLGSKGTSSPPSEVAEGKWRFYDLLDCDRHPAPV